MIIPIHLLWHIRINLRQKLILGATLCLSIVMIIIAIIRMSKFRIASTKIDIIWDVFWEQVEACMAVIMVSISAFRSFFVAHETRLRENQIRNRPWYMSKQNTSRSAYRRRKLQSESEEMDQLPEIPRATMTGMRTFIDRGKINTESQFSSVGTEDATTLADDDNAQKIKVNYTISTDSHDVSPSCKLIIFTPPFLI